MKLNKSLEIKYLKLNEITPYARNARVHSNEQVQQIASSVREFGFVNPILIDNDNEIIAGHGRLEAARVLEMDMVPVIQIGHLTKTQKRGLVLADNQIALNAGWNEELLQLELSSLNEEGFDIELTGFNAEQLEKAMFENLEDPQTQDKPLNFIISYNIVFDDETQQDTWFKFVRYLRSNFPDNETIGERLTQLITDNGYMED